MMNTYNFYCAISGKSFYPSALAIESKEFLIAAMNDPGGPELVDPKNPGPSSTIVDYGNLVLSPSVPVTDDFDSAFSTFLGRLKDFVDKLPSGDWDVLVHVNVEYVSQCNFELSTALLSALETLKATFTLSCYEIE